MEAINAIGRRKAAVARVYLMDGKGKITVNGKDYNDYFGSDILKYVVTQPLNELDATDRYDIVVNLEGGGIRGQAEAVRLGISRALVSLDGGNKKPLKEKGFLTRDSRVVERKKPGRPKARKRFQFSKR
ncbi:MAG: 30S ribosomal protein S9 [Bacteroidetes bacterium]|nr:30S ribosomal protein S9 [Bacteroidota bacterium]